MPLLISNLGLAPDHRDNAPLDAGLKRLSVRREQVKGWGVLRCAVDARRRGAPKLVYSVYLELRDKPLEKRLVAKLSRKQVALETTPEGWQPRAGDEVSGGRIAIIGAGPAGLSAAWRLAEAGYSPLLLERGGQVGPRSAAVAALERRGELDPESNYCFGEGGAGCFSDGKLHTRKNDFRAAEFLELLVECGAPQEISFEGRPHVGSDKLPAAVRKLREKIAAAGGEVRSGARVESLDLDAGRVRALRLAGGEELAVGALVLAPGASARELFAALQTAGVELEPRPLQMGLRLECSQDEIDELLYGRWAGHPRVGAAEFFLKNPAGDDYPAAHSFCMCPGGEVVPVVTEPGGLSTNGASRRARASGFANVAVVAAVPAAENTEAGIELQRRIERAAFELGGGDYSFPCSTVADFLEDREPDKLPDAPKGVRRKPARLAGLLPPEVEAAVRSTLENFARRMPPLGGDGATLYAAETRVGSPVRIQREPDGRARGLSNLYPAGEGSGYAAGIMSSAIDGMKAAEQLIARFACPGE
jgi:uncharacterized protein